MIDALGERSKDAGVGRDVSRDGDKGSGGAIIGDGGASWICNHPTDRSGGLYCPCNTGHRCGQSNRKVDRWVSRCS